MATELAWQDSTAELAEPHSLCCVPFTFKSHTRDKRLQPNGYAFQIEMTMKAYAKGFRIKEIPIVFYDRTRGNSKMSFHIAIEAAWVVWKLRFLKIIGRL